MLTCRSGRGDRGSVLLLFPAGFMIVIVLGALAVDVGLSQVRAHELQAVASSAADDALAALDIDALRERDVLELDGDEVRRIVAETVAAGPLSGVQVLEIDVRDHPDAHFEIAVTLRVSVDFALAPALTRHLSSTTITRTGTALVL